jgi:hypothetical protein
VISYGEAIDWCVKNNAVFRFVNRRDRSQFVILNESIPGDKAVELAADVYGRTCVVHCALDSSVEPSNALAKALIGCVGHLIKQQKRSLIMSAN